MQEEYSLPDAWQPVAEILEVGLCGVDIFFVISGFIMALITRDMHQQPGAIRNFAQKRLFRIAPPYWLWTLFFSILLALLPQLASTRTFSWQDTILSCLFIPFVPTAHNSAPVLAVGWTLSYEMYFYALVCLGLLTTRTIFIVGLGLFFLATTLFLPSQGPISGLLSSTLLWEFYAGVLLHELSPKLPSIRARTALGMSLAALGLFYAFSAQYNTQWRFLYWGGPALLLTGTLACMREVKETWLSRLGVFLGDSSYTLYLSHLITLPAVAKGFVLLGLHTALPPLLQVFLYSASCIVVGALLYTTTERPILTRLNKVFPTPPVRKRS